MKRESQFETSDDQSLRLHRRGRALQPPRRPTFRAGGGAAFREELHAPPPPRAKLQELMSRRRTGPGAAEDLRGAVCAQLKIASKKETIETRQEVGFAAVGFHFVHACEGASVILGVVVCLFLDTGSNNVSICESIRSSLQTVQQGWLCKFQLQQQGKFQVSRLGPYFQLPSHHRVLFQTDVLFSMC